ncbi:hypothetical protein M0802_016803 [Mischocyttarus mexicanus]|nr:hypothetical protein M0802_016803 [Mischocyttarus mexicanus]
MSKGPAFWGLINPDWWLCNKGRRQSPVNLEPNRLLFDPNLQPLHLDKHKVGGVLANTGHSVVFAVENDTRHPVNISGGSLSYRYQFHEIHLHFGLEDHIGSEHTIDGHAFPAELQIFGFNSQLYNNFSDALHRAQGIVAVSLLLQVGDLSNPQLRTFTEQLDKIKYGGEKPPRTCEAYYACDHAFTLPVIRSNLFSFLYSLFFTTHCVPYYSPLYYLHRTTISNVTRFSTTNFTIVILLENISRMVNCYVRGAGQEGGIKMPRDILQ